MSPVLQQRISAMYGRDRAIAWFAVLMLWAAIGFVLWAVEAEISDPAIQWTLRIGALMVLVFNTASIGAMVRHFAEDKQHIYGLDIHHLDANRRNRRG